MSDFLNSILHNPVKIREGVYYMTPEEESAFPGMYLQLRSKEGRTYSDSLLSQLPRVPNDHTHKKEWGKRAASLQRLSDYLQRRKGLTRLLDIGCGNGWFAANLAHIEGVEVLAMDVGIEELEQGARVFGERKNLRFVYVDVFAFPAEEKLLDIITMGASVQYFQDMTMLVKRLRSLLREGGEIHIVDSPFYLENEKAEAAVRSRAYYEKMGFPALAGFYHHHSLQQIQSLGGEVMYDPGSFGNKVMRKLGRNDSPFPWIRIAK